MLLENVNYKDIYDRQWKYIRSNFWSKINFPVVYKSKLIRYVAIWDMPWRCCTVIIAEPVLLVYLLAAIIQYQYLKLRKLPGSDAPLYRIRILQFLKNSCIFGKNIA